MAGFTGMLFVLLAGAAPAAPITTPLDEPAGSIFQWQTAALTGTIDSLMSVDLTIAGGNYALGEVGFLVDTDESRIIWERHTLLPNQLNNYGPGGFSEFS